MTAPNGKPAWWQPPLARGAQQCGCLNCGPKPNRLNLRQRIAVGFGDAYASRDGAVVLREAHGPHVTDKDSPTVQQAENMARKDPNHDWRIRFYGPLSGQTYQRHGRNEWVLVDTDRGFA